MSAAEHDRPADSPRSYFQVRDLLDEGALDLSGLQASRIQVLDYLLTHVMYKGDAYGWVTDEHCLAEFLTERLGLSIRTVKSALTDLEDSDLIRRRYREHGTPGKGNPKRIRVPWLAGCMTQQATVALSDDEATQQATVALSMDTVAPSVDTVALSVRARFLIEEVKEPEQRAEREAGDIPGDHDIAARPTGEAPDPEASSPGPREDHAARWARQRQEYDDLLELAARLRAERDEAGVDSARTMIEDKLRDDRVGGWAHKAAWLRRYINHERETQELDLVPAEIENAAQQREALADDTRVA